MDVNSIPIDQIDVSDQDRFEAGDYHPYFERLRKEDPVHFCDSERFGPYWSVTRYADIVEVEKNHEVFSSSMDHGGVTIGDRDFDDVMDVGESFITLDPPRSRDQRNIVAPAFTPASIKDLESDVRLLVTSLLDRLPVNRTFDWVDGLANHLPILVLARLFGLPEEDSHKLLRWSNLFVGTDDKDVVETRAAAREELKEFVTYFETCFSERAETAPAADILSLLAHSGRPELMSRRNRVATMALLLIGGNDTTRNTISGGLWALNQNPGEYLKLRKNPGLIPLAVSEMLRWISPIAHMRRTAVADTELGGKIIRTGDKVVMWYVSGNRDESVFENPDSFQIDRPGPRHLSFGTGVHHCIGSRLAELQLRILWEELLLRYPVIEPRGNPAWLWSNFINGIKSMPVFIPAR